MQVFKRHWFVFSITCILLLIGASLAVGILFVSSLNSTNNHQIANGSATNVAMPGPTAITGIAHHTWKKGAYLEIPAIALAAPIEDVGIQNSGDMDVPSHNQWEGVGWYKFGTFPGDPGSAVIDGHLDRPGGYPAVFWNLKKLHVGDLIKVVNPGEKMLHFQVKEMDYYQPQDAPLPKIFGDRSGIYLNLVTCAGEWIPEQHQTTLRLVVYTQLVK